MGRTPSDPPPTYTLGDAIIAAECIYRLRSEGYDHDLGFFPWPVQDDDDVDQVIRYCESHRHVSIDVLSAELHYRAVLATYKRQRDNAANDRHDLAILEAGEDTHTPGRVYGKAMGLPTRSSRTMRRDRLRRRLRPERFDAGPAPKPRNAGRRSDPVEVWLRAHGDEVLSVAEQLVDYREAVLSQVEDPQRRDHLAEAIDEAGRNFTRRPGRTLAAAVAFAAFHLDPARYDDPVIRDLIAQAHRLRDGFNTTRD